MSCDPHQCPITARPLVADIPVWRAVNSLVIVPAILKRHAHCVAVQVFVVSDVFAHGDFLFVVCVDGLILTHHTGSASDYFARHRGVTGRHSNFFLCDAYSPWESRGRHKKHKYHNKVIYI